MPRDCVTFDMDCTFEAGTYARLMASMSRQTWIMDVARTVKRWQFPEEKFVRYEDSDEWWCRALGIGKEIEVQETMTFPNVVVESIKDGELTVQLLPSEAGT